MSSLPADIGGQVLDAIGNSVVIGSLSEGTREAQVILRAYIECIKQLTQAANWSWARKTAPLQLLADATMQTPNVGTVVPSGFIYEYALPTDCLKVRFVPMNRAPQGNGIPAGNIAIPSQVPIMTNLGAPYLGQRIIPARYVIATDPNYAGAPGQLTWDVMGISPETRTVILTDVKDAHCTYTALVIYPQIWDSLFRAALVAYIASEVALPLTTDRKLGLAIRSEQIQIAKAKLELARLTDANAAATTSSDIRVDWIEGRRTGGSGFYGNGGGWGGGFGGDSWSACGFADGTVY